MAGKVACALVALVVVGGCTPEAESAVADPVVTSAAPGAEVGYAARRQAVLSIPNADGLVAAVGAVWVKTDDGTVVRVDPRTNKVTGRVKVDTTSDTGKYCLGIGADETTVWACSETDGGTAVVRIDPRTLKVLSRVPVGKVFDQLTLAVTARGIWVLTKDGTTISVVEEDGRVSSYPLGAKCLQLTAGTDRVIATCPEADAVVAVDAVTGVVTSKVTLEAPRLAAVAGDDLWVDAAGGLTHLTRDLEVRTVYPGLGAGVSGDLIATADEVLVRTGDGTITTVEAAGGEVTERLTPDVKLTGGSLLVAYDSVWTTSGDDGKLVRLSQ